VTLLVLESWPKTVYLKQRDQYSPEELTGVFGRAVFWWVNPILLLGNHSALQEKDLFPLDHALQSRVVEEEVTKLWERSDGP
jgi:ATP-binding cassette subfamily C (CFTR/MRP) protein 1